MRKIATVVAALMLPVQAHALGVGEIEWDSTLNQPLDAEISLFSLGSVQENDIRVRLAPYDAYEKAGIEYPSILRTLKFSVEQRGNGKFYIKIHSTDAIKDPFLDILLEIDWPSGHLMREFTVLLDLPTMTDEAAGPVSTPVTAAPARVTEPSASVTNETPAAQGQVFGETSQQRVSNQLRVGMVKRGDTLWGIAETMRTDKSVSVQQVMLALLKSNPRAFYNNNINNLKAGYVLRLDNPNLITEISKEEAAREAQRQYQAWLTAKGRKTAAAGSGKSPDSAIGSGAAQGAGSPSLRLVAPDQADVGIPDSAGGAGQARNVANMNLAALRQELDAALQTSDADKQENEQLRARIAELEGQISKMQRLLSLRDDALSVLQAKPEEQSQQNDQSATATIAPPAAAGADASATANQSTTAGEAAASKETAGSVAAPQQTQPAGTKAAKQNKATSKPGQPAARDEGFVTTVMGYVRRTLSAAGSMLNPVALGGVVGGLLLLVGGAWFLRKRKISAEDLEHSMMVEVADKQLSEDLANGTVTDLDQNQKEETRAVDLLDSTGGDNLEADIDEIDVLAEADVYLAYQRFDRAEELMREAISNEPQRLDLHFKLLEVFAASGNRDGFMEMARAIQSKGGQEDTSMWSKVVAMGEKIAAGDPLFSGAAPDTDAATLEMHTSSEDKTFAAELPGGEIEANFDTLDDDLMLDLDAHIAADTPAVQTDAAIEQLDDTDTISSGADLELSDNAPGLEEISAAVEDNDTQTSADEVPADNDEPLEFNLDESLSLDSAETADDGTAERQSEAYVPDNTLEFEPAATEATAVDAAADDTEATTVLGSDDDAEDDFVFDNVEALAGDTADDDLTVAAESESTVTDSSDGGSEGVEFEFDSPASESETASSLDDDLNDDIDWLTGVADDEIDDDSDSFFSSEDEVATKLDLIRAYIDMGDKESARNILTEVVEEGNDNQKQEAEELLRQIG